VNETTPNHSSACTITLTLPLREAERILGVRVATACERLARLTQREQQVATLIAAGKSNQDIASELDVSIKTVEVHRVHVRIKLEAATLVHVANLVHLVRLAEAAQATAE
jgi:FixJ family two-component response regulator